MIPFDPRDENTLVAEGEPPTQLRRMEVVNFSRLSVSSLIDEDVRLAKSAAMSRNFVETIGRSRS